MSAGEPVVADIAAIWERHRPSVLEGVDLLERAVAALVSGELDDALRREAEREAHKLAGSLGTFGYVKGSDDARELELSLKTAGGLGPSQVLRLSELVVGLRTELEAPSADAGAGLPASHDEDGPLILVVDDDFRLTERLAAEGASRGLRVQTAPSVPAARIAVRSARPDAVLLDLRFRDETAAAYELLSRLSAGDPPVPVLVFTVSDEFTDRVEVARRGGMGFLSKALRPSQVMDAVTQLLDRRRATQTSVLAVDDDPAVLDVLRGVLEDEGLVVTTLSDPSRFWSALEEDSPDLVVLDFDMPGVTGLDLCRMLRNDQRWATMPVIVLTGRTDADSVNQVFTAGGDDYLSKPLVASELRTRISNRLERMRLYRTLAYTDSLTGVSNRHRSADALEQLLRLANRYAQPLSLAEVDIDRFKEVNDRFGHAAGDAVLRRLGELLRRAFRGEDVVARWGGEEFVIGMYGMSRDDGVRRLSGVLQQLRDERFGPAEQRFGVTFSAGVAQYPGDGTDVNSLYRAADEALYRAKEAGRDRVLAAGWTAEGDHQSVDVVVVEDDEILADLLLHALETRGHTTRWLSDGPAAANALASSSAELSGRVVLLDVDLPGLDGVAILRRMLEQRVLEHSRVIMLTGRTSETEVLAALELGAFDHVGKPFSVPVLMQKISRALVS